MKKFNLTDSEGNFRVYVENYQLYKQYENENPLFECIAEPIDWKDATSEMMEVIGLPC